MSLVRWLVVSIVLLGWLAAPAWAVAPRMHDEGKFFSPEAIAKADQKVKEIYRTQNKDLLIETVADIPANLEAKFKEQGKAKFFTEWADQRAEDAVARGIYILLCKNPAHLQIIVDRATRAKALTLADRDRLVEKMVALLKEKKNDEALQLAVEFVQSTLKANTGR